MSDVDEIWKPCYDNPLYEVSSLGRVRSYVYYNSKKRNDNQLPKPNDKYKEPKILKQNTSYHGYKTVCFCYPNGIQRTRFVHKLVASAFVNNPDPNVYTEVNHIDGDKQNNFPENLEWVTHQQNMQHARINGLYTDQGRRNRRNDRGRPVYCVETNKVYPSIIDAAEELGVHGANISAMCRGRKQYVGGYTFRYIDTMGYTSNLFEHQKDAVERLHNGAILVGSVGSGKSRTALEYFAKYECKRLKKPKPLYIITTARKRDSLEWGTECVYYGISSDSNMSRLPLTIDSWNNLHKYTEAKNAFFIFDEQRVVGYGAWTKSFLKITKQNRWLLLSATPGDTWMDYIPVFIANGFYKNKTEFIARHVVYSRFSKFPKVERYLQEDVLEKHKRSILVEMNFTHSMQSHTIMVECDFNSHDLMRVYRGRWNVFENRPIQQAGEWCRLMRKIVNSHHSRLEKILDIFEEKKRIIVFYNFDYELEVLKDGLGEYFERSSMARDYSFCAFSGNVREYNGHRHDPVPDGDRWVYLVQYNAASEAWNCIATDTIVFYSLNYSYKIMEQASGRIRRMNSPYSHLYYYVLYSKSIIDKSILTALKNKKDFNAGRLYRKNFEGGKYDEI